MNSKILVKYPVAIEWRIAEHRLQERRNSIKRRLDSTHFNIPGTDYKYYVMVYPNGCDDETRGKTTIFFGFCSDEQKQTEAEITVSIETSNFTQKLERFGENSWVCSPCTTDELFDPETRFIANGEMVVKVDGFLMIEKDAPAKLCQLGNTENSLGYDLWKQGNKDFTIVADGKKIYAHKMILSTRSPVFAAMFQPHTQEAKDNRVVIPDFAFHIVETAIKLCYDSRLVEKDVPIDDQIFVLQFFDKYDVQSLKSDLENYIISEIDESNVCHLVNISLFLNAPRLKEKCGQFLQQCFRENKLLNDFDALDKDYIIDVLKKSFTKISD